ncbi:LysE family transporter [uncultured Acinetobacter sp.]|uniref:LysE family transporter n=1 Tax=uncultured Acinetobacter sp. TaxID=165433 RepID=UPI002582C142|nr:LysE family transporter [uncultured Acinetobacter sp.]
MEPFSNGFLLSLSLCLDIGIANIAIINLAMQRGYFQGLWLGIGTCVGDLIYAVLALAGMSILLQYEPIRWLLWIGGGAILIWFTIKMLKEALQKKQEIQLQKVVKEETSFKSFGKGMILAMSSPTAILWFATVGGALISRMGNNGSFAVSWFLVGFFIAGIFWAAVLSGVGGFGSKLLGKNILKYSYIASAVIFAYFSFYVIYSGYKEFILS